MIINKSVTNSESGKRFEIQQNKKKIIPKIKNVYKINISMYNVINN